MQAEGVPKKARHKGHRFWLITIIVMVLAAAAVSAVIAVAKGFTAQETAVRSTWEVQEAGALLHEDWEIRRFVP